MKRLFSFALVLVFCLGLLPASAEISASVSQKTVIGALNEFMQKNTLGTAFSGESDKPANLEFSQTLFLYLFNVELGGEEFDLNGPAEEEQAPTVDAETENTPPAEGNDGTPPSAEGEKTEDDETDGKNGAAPVLAATNGNDQDTAQPKLGLDLSASTVLNCFREFESGATPTTDELNRERSKLKLGSLIQHGKGGHIAFYLGELDEENVVVYDCGFGGDDLIRLRIVSNTDLKKQAKESGLSFFRYNELPDNFGSENVALNLLQKPSKTAYYVGEAADASGARLEYVVGTQKNTFSAPKENLQIYAATAEDGKTPLLFLYDGALAFCTLEVSEQTVEKIEIQKKPSKLSYSTEEEIDMAGASVVATKLDGTTVALKPSDYTLEYDFSLAEGEAKAEKTVRILYCGKSCEFTVEVTRPDIFNLRVFFQKTEYFVGEPLKYDDAYLLYDTEEKKDERIGIDFSMLGTIDTSTPGDKTVTVTHQGATASFTVTYLEKEVVTLALKTKLNERYRAGTALDLANIELVVTYEDSSTATISAKDCEVTVDGVKTTEFTEAGTCKVVFTYRGVSTAAESVTVIREEGTSFLPWLIVILVLLLAIPTAVLLTLYFVRKKQQTPPSPTDPTEAEPNDTPFPFAGTFPEAEEEVVASFDELEEEADEDGDVRIFDEKDLPKVDLSEIRETPEDQQGHTRKIDFFDDL